MPAAANQVLKPDRLLKELSELWTTMGKPDENQGSPDGGVLRACAMTLITIVDESDDGAGIGETLAMLMRDHPSRAIVIRLTNAEGVLEGRVFAQCWMPFGHRRQICCEQVEITVSGNRLEDIPGIVSPLAVPDLPIAVWLRSRDLPESPVTTQILDLGDRIIFDSHRGGATALKEIRTTLDRGRLGGDLAWTRTTEVRELLAQLLSGRNPEDLGTPEIDYCGEKLCTEALYVAGWLDRAFSGKNTILNQVAGKEAIREVRIAPDIQVKLGESCANFQVGKLHERASFGNGTDYELLNEELRITVRDRVFEAVLRQIT